MKKTPQEQQTADTKPRENQDYSPFGVAVVEDHGNGDIETTFYTLAAINDEIDVACDGGTYSPTWIMMQCLFQLVYREIQQTRSSIRRVEFTFAGEGVGDVPN